MPGKGSSLVVISHRMMAKLYTSAFVVSVREH